MTDDDVDPENRGRKDTTHGSWTTSGTTFRTTSHEH